MKRLVKFIIILAVIGLIVFGVGYFLKGCSGTNEPPAMEKAQYKVTAEGRYFFTSKYEEGKNYFGKYITMFGYYALTNDLKWVYHSGELTLSERAFKILNVTRRTNGQ